MLQLINMKKQFKLINILWAILVIVQMVMLYVFYIQNYSNIKSTPNNSIVKISTCKSSNLCEIGTGSIIGWNEKTKTAKIGTALHVVSAKNKEDLYIESDNQKVIFHHKNQTWKIISKNQSSDSCVIEEKLLRVTKPYVYQLANLKAGEKVSVKGYPGGYKKIKLREINNVQTQQLSQYFEIESSDTNTQKASIINQKNGFKTQSMGKGNSGGPVLNSKNQIIGFISSGITSAQEEEKIFEKQKFPRFESYASNSSNWKI